MTIRIRVGRLGARPAWEQGVGESFREPTDVLKQPTQPRRPIPMLTRALPNVGRMTLLIVLVGLAWRVTRYAMNFPMWGDESSLAMSLILRDFRNLASPPLEYNQIAPLGYMWLGLIDVRLLGSSEWVLRLPAFLASVLSIVLFWRFVRGLVDRHAALLAVAILAASYYPVRHGTEVKPYAMDLLISLGLTALAWWTAKQVGSAGRWVLLTLAAAVAVWLSYPAVFVVAGMGLYLGWTALHRRSLGSLIALVAFALVAAGSFVWVYLLYIRPQAMASQYYFVNEMWKAGFPPWAAPWRLPWWLLETHTGNMMAYPIGGKNFGSSLTFLLVIAGCVSLWRKGRRDLLMLWLSPLVFAFGAAAAKKYPYGPSARVMLYMGPGFCLLAGVGLRAILSAVTAGRWAGEAMRLAAAVLGLIAVVGLATDIAYPYKALRYRLNRDAVVNLAARTHPGDQWVLANTPSLGSSCAVPFRYYLTRLAPGPVQWAPTPADVPSVHGRTFLIYFHDPKNEDAREDGMYQQYVQALTARFGPPLRFDYTLDQPDLQYSPPSIRVCQFSVPRAGATSR